MLHLLFDSADSEDSSNEFGYFLNIYYICRIGLKNDIYGID